jgi:PAS domain S-box-containing protein
MKGKGGIILAFCLNILILTIISVYGYKSTLDYKHASDRVGHTQQVITHADRLFSEVQDLETAQGDYVITGKEKYREFFQEGIRKSEDSYWEVKNLILDNPYQLALLDSIYNNIQLNIAFAKKVFSLRLLKGHEDADALVSTEAGENLMKKTRGLIDNFIRNENELFSDRSIRAKQHYALVLTIIIASIFLTLVIVLTTLYFFIRDYNTRILSEKKLNEKKELIRKLYEFQNIILNETDYSIITTEDPDSIITSFNKGAEKMLGYSAGEMVGKISPAIIHDKAEVESHARFLSKELNIAVEPGIDVFHIKSRLGSVIDVNEWTYVRKDGTRITVELSVTTLRNKNNVIIGYLEIAKDITEKKKAEALIKESELLIKKFFDCMPIGIYIVGADGKPYYANSKFRQILGKGIIPDLAPDDFPEVYKAYLAGTDDIYPSDIRPLVRALRGEKNICVEDMEILKDGIRIPLRINATSVTNAEDKIEYAISLFEDITDIKEAKEQLIQAKKVADESVILKETFLANMSHEIRTPMNAIIGFTDLLLKKNLQVREKEYVQIIKNSGESLLRIINDILDVSKINSGMMTFEEYPISIKEIFTSLSVMLSPKARMKDLNMSFKCEKHLPDMVMGDPTRLTQIILNLVGNAIKFTEKGGVAVFAKVLHEDAKICQVEFSVRDTGIGIPEAKLESIFERFTQAETSITRSHGGTGLGLNIAKRLTELQGGKMTVSSIVGEGSVFTFSLPFSKSDTDTTITKQKLTDLNIQELANSKILIVEDNPINVKFVLSLLSEYNINADIAENGKQAVEKIKDNLYDIVLMDMEMPEMNGYEATAAIRNELKMSIPIIAMTAHAMMGEKEKCIEAGMNDYISKPISADKLFEKMFLVLKSEKEKSITRKNKIINLDYLIESMGGNEEVISDIIDIFLKQIPVDLAVINEAVSKSDYLTIKQFSHRMKSTVSVMGISVIETILSEMETLGASEKEIGKIKLLSDQLNNIFHIAIQEAELEKANFGVSNHLISAVIPQPIILQ